MTSKGKGVKDHEGVSQTGRMSDAKKQLLKAGWKKKSVEESLYEKSFTPKMVKMAIGIASDDRYAGNNMTGATKAIEKIAKGLSGHPQVQAVLKKQNEELDEAKSQLPEGFLDTFLGRNMKKGNVDKKRVKKSDNAEQVKLSTEINRKLRLIDDLMQKVRPLGGNLGKLMAFRRLSISKMTPKGMYIALNDWWDSIEADLDDDSEDDNEKYARSAEKLYDLWEEVGFKLSDYMWASGYDVKGIGQMAKIGFPAKKRTDPEWLKMNESVELDEKGPKIGVDRLKQQRDADSKIDIKGAKKRKPRVSSTKKNLSSISDRANKKAMESFDLVSEASLIPALRDIADNKSATKVKGTLVDMFTASMITQIYDKVNDANKTKMDKLPLEKLVNIAHKIMKKEDREMTTSKNEAKSDYTIMHKSYSDAMSHAYDVAKKRGYEVDMDDVMDKVSMGPRKPSEGKTNSHNLTVTKGGKPVKKQLNVQVYNRGGSVPYELNMYIEELETENEPMTHEQKLTAEERAFVESLNQNEGYGKINATYGKKKKEEELSPKQKKIDKNKNGKIDGSDLASLRAKNEETLNELGNKYVMDTRDLAKVQKALNAMGATAPKIVKDKAGYFHIKFQSKVGNTGRSTSSGHQGPYHTMAAVLDGLMKMQKESTENLPLDRMLQPSMHQQTLEIDEKKNDYEDHMMYDPKTGKGRMTTSYEDHLALKDKGWGHEKPTKESVNPLDERKLTWKDWELQGNDAWMSREKRKDNPYKKKGQARTSWFDGWDNMQMDSDNGDFDESYGKMNASKMSSKEKAKARALAKADRDAQPKDKVSLKKAPWDKKESVELDESAGDMEKAAAELEAYAKKSGGMDKNTFMRVATLLKTGHPDKLKSYINNMDTDPREYVAMLLKKHVGKKSAEKMMDIKFRGESISWEDAETLRAAGVKLDEISSDMKKRYNKAALKDRDQQKNTLKRADDVGSKVVDGAVTNTASPSQTNSRLAKLDKIRQKADKKLANRRKGLATPGKGSTTKVKDYFGMAETKKPVSQMTDKEKVDNAAKRKEYKAYQKSKRNEEVKHLIEASDKQDAKEMSEIVREMNPKYTDAQVAKEVEKMAMEKYDNKPRAKKIAAHI